MAYRVEQGNGQVCYEETNITPASGSEADGAMKPGVIARGVMKLPAAAVGLRI